MNFTSVATLLLSLLSCEIVFGQLPLEGTLPALTADSQQPAPISSTAPPPLDDLTTLTPSWQNVPDSTMTLVPFEQLPSVSQPGWFARGDSMFLNLSRGSNQPLVYKLLDSHPGTPGSLVVVGPVITTNSISSNRFDAVPRVTLGYRFDDAVAVEATYFGADNWSGSAFAGTSPAIIGLATPDGLVSQGVSTNLASSLYSAEMNVFQPFDIKRHLEILAGLRYFQLNELLNLQTGSDVNGTIYQSRYNLQTKNNLYGAQVGLRWTRERNRWSVTAIGKTGVYFNDASQEQSLGYTSNLLVSPPRDMTASKPSVSLIQELGINCAYQLTRSCSIRAGYNLFMIQGLARVTEQIDFSSNRNPLLYTHGSAILHGPSAGVEFRF